jgi:ribonuclease-3
MLYYESLQHQLHYTFHGTHLLEEAFIADGAVKSRNDLDGPPSGNKRLALIGDAVIRLSVLEEWFLSGGTTGE